MVLLILSKAVFSAIQIEARGKKFGLVCTVSFPQYISSLVPVLLTSVVAKTKPMRIALSCLLHKGTKFRAKRSRTAFTALRVDEGRVQRSQATAQGER